MGTLSDLGRMVILFMFCFFLVGYVNGSVLMFVISLFCLVLLCVAWMSAWIGTRGVHCTRKLPDSAIFSQDPYETDIILTEESPRRRWLEIFDQHANLITGKITIRHMHISTEGDEQMMAAVSGEAQDMTPHGSSGRRLVIRDTIRFPQRGRYRLGPIKILSYDPLGLCCVSRDYAETDEVLVYPQALPVPEIIFSGAGGLHETEVREKVHAGEAVDFFGIRPYVQGDDLRRIHWKSSAHTGKLAVKEYEFHTSGGLHIILDLHQTVHQGSETYSTLESSVIIATSLLNYTLHAGNQAGLLTTGKQVISMLPDSGQRQLQRALEALALAQCDGEVPLAKVLANSEGMRTGRNTIMVITPTVDIDILPPLLRLRARAPQVLLVLLNPYSYYQAERREAQAGFSLLARLLHPLKAHVTHVEIPDVNAHTHLLQSARAAKIDAFAINADLSLHRALQGVRSSMRV